MDRRPELHAILCSMLGSSHVYFQPLETVRMSYPCIIYRLGRFDIKHADNKAYLGKKCYTVTLVSKDPDFSLVDEMVQFPLCSFDRFYTADNLNHWIFELYY